MYQLSQFSGGRSAFLNLRLVECVLLVEFTHSINNDAHSLGHDQFLKGGEG